MSVLNPSWRSICLACMFAFSAVGFLEAQQQWKPDVDWGHWRLGQKADLDFLKKNHMTVTFGGGAPNFEEVTRDQFTQGMEKARALNQKYHEQNYIVLRYLSSSLGGQSASNKDTPRADQIRLLKFFNENWSDFEDYIGPKPEEDPTNWMTVRPDGSFPFYRYAPYGKEPGPGFETWGCPNNPYFVQMMEGRMRAQAETGIDGSYIDWTQIAGETCYCKFCRKAFVAYLQKNLPLAVSQKKYGVSKYDAIEPPRKRGDPFWMEWITFRGTSVAEFHRHLRAIARKVNPHFMISGNIFGGFGYGPIAYDAAGNVELLGRDEYDDFIYSEIQEFLDSAPRKSEEGVKITNSPALKFLAAAAHNKPNLIYATEITPPIFPNPSEQCLSAMAQINIAEAVSNHAIFREKRETPPGATQIYEFLFANENKLRGAHLYSNIAVLASLNQYLADELSFTFSTSRVLADKGISHVLIVEDDLLSRDLLGYDLVVLPYLPVLSLARQDALVRYVKKGGCLLVLGTCGLKDEFNLPLPRSPLATMLGKEAYPDAAIQRTIGLGRVAFIPLPIPPSRFLIPMKAKGEYTTFGPTMADLFADIPEGYTRNRMNPALRQILEKIPAEILRALPDRATRLLEPAPYTEITTMLNREATRMLVHFVNYNVTVGGLVTPVQNLKVEAAIPEGKKVRSLNYSGSLSVMKPLDYKVTRHGTRQSIVFEAGEVDIYGLAVIELE